MSDLAVAREYAADMERKCDALCGEMDALVKQNEELEALLEYAYRCVADGFRTGTFDFSLLHDRAKMFIKATGAE